MEYLSLHKQKYEILQKFPSRINEENSMAKLSGMQFYDDKARHFTHFIYELSILSCNFTLFHKKKQKCLIIANS